MSRTWHSTSELAGMPGWKRRPSRDRVRYWCECDRPAPRPVTLFGVAMGGIQECATCRMPIERSASTNPRGLRSLSIVMLALTTGQRLVFALVALVFVVVFVVWPVTRPRSSASEREARAERRRLLEEIRRQDHDDTP